MRVSLLKKYRGSIWFRLPVLGAILIALLIVMQLLFVHFRSLMPVQLKEVFWFTAEVVAALIMIASYKGMVRLTEDRVSQELSWLPNDKSVLVGLSFGVLMFSLVCCGLFAVGAVNQFTYQGFDGFSFAMSSALYAAVGEEIVFRGVLFRIVEERAGTLIALLVSASLFGLLHAFNPGSNWISTLAIALEAGILLGLAYAMTRTLWFPIGLHFAWNFSEGGIYGAAVSGVASDGVFHLELKGSPVITGGAFGPETSIIAVIVCLLVSILFAIRLVRRDGWIHFSPTGNISRND